MSTAKKFTHNETEYFDGLPEATQRIVKELILEAAQDRNGPEGWKLDEDCLEEVECRARDGFIPYSSNRGGLTYDNFTDLHVYWGGGYAPAHEGASKEIERQIERSFKDLSEHTFEHYKTRLEAIGVTVAQCNYRDLEELSTKPGAADVLKEALDYVSDGELEVLSDENSSIMHQLRFLYHGSEKGLHKASVSAAVNTEGPYHRSYISWAPGVFCEGSKEVEITWKNNAELKRKLAKALGQVSKEIF